MNKHFLFSGGEVHCKINEYSDKLIVKDYTMNGFMALAEHVEVYRRAASRKEIHAVYPYLPYARQDRVMEINEPFSLKIFCDLLNSLNLSSVEIWDPHSDVTPALINNCRIAPQWNLARETLPNEYFSNPDYLFISPDAGAYKKLTKLIYDDSRIAIGVKNRDATGKVTHTAVFSPTEIDGHNCVIVDDICDGGRTFIELAKVLKKLGAKSVILYVTHGIFSKGFDELKQYIDKIHTTDSFNNVQTDYLFVREFL